jgi:dTDP-4-amino-4,6-dideoxygalactose transaminase
MQPAYADLGYHQGDFPVTEEVANTCLSLPLYPELTAVQQDRIVELIYTFLKVQR